MVSFPKVPQPKSCMHLFLPPNVPHILPITFFLMWSPEYCLMITDHTVPCSVFFPHFPVTSFFLVNKSLRYLTILKHPKPYRCKMTNRFVKELVDFITVFQILPNMFRQMVAGTCRVTEPPVYTGYIPQQLATPDGP
jgi:hypothetical protein